MRRADLSRRAASLIGLVAAAAGAQTGTAERRVEDSSFRYRWTSVNAVFLRAKRARAEQLISYSAYTALVQVLAQEETSISDEVRRHKFTDQTESNFWHRGTLKFPTNIQTELRLIEAGKDPASR